MDLRLDASDFLRRTNDLLARKMPRVEADAVNWTAYDALAAVKDRMRTVFDNPTPFTQNAFFVRRATPSNPVATLQRKDRQAGRHFLEVQDTGGRRPQSALERSMMFRVVTPDILQAVVPARGARLNRYGNWSPGERNQALSEIGAQRDATANATATSIARARGRGRASYFVPRNGGLSPGIWKRTGRGDLSKVVHFVDRMPVYRPRLDFEDTVRDEYARRIERNLRRAFARAMGAGG